MISTVLLLLYRAVAPKEGVGRGKELEQEALASEEIFGRGKEVEQEALAPKGKSWERKGAGTGGSNS